MTELHPIRWVVNDREPKRQLLWFCSDLSKAIWVEPMSVEVLDNAEEIMAKVLLVINEHCGTGGEVLFGDDPTEYRLRRVELRTNGEIERTITFASGLVEMNPHLVMRLITLVAHKGEDAPTQVNERRFLKGTTLAQAIDACEKLAVIAGSNAGYVLLEDDLWYHLDRIELYNDSHFVRTFPLDLDGFIVEED